MLQYGKSLDTIATFSVIIYPCRSFAESILLTFCPLGIYHCSPAGHGQIGGHPCTEKRVVRSPDMHVHQHFHGYLNINLGHGCRGGGYDIPSGIFYRRKCPRAAPDAFIGNNDRISALPLYLRINGYYPSAFKPLLPVIASVYQITPEEKRGVMRINGIAHRCY